MLAPLVWLSLQLASSAAAHTLAPLELQTGSVDFSRPHPFSGGPLLASFQLAHPALPSRARAALQSALPALGGALVGLLPPHAFLLHLPNASLGALQAALGADWRFSGLAPQHRTPLLAGGGGGAAAPPLPAGRALRVTLAHAAAAAPLAAALAAACPACALQVAGLTALVAPPPGAAPVPAPALRALAALEGVLWAELQPLPARAHNAFEAGIVTGTDVQLLGVCGMPQGLVCVCVIRGRSDCTLSK